jgi:RES domain-containing protein
MPATVVKLTKDPVDAALDESFPASDPPSTSVPVTATAVSDAMKAAVTISVYRIIPGGSRHDPFGPKAPWPERRWANPETGLIRMAPSLPMAMIEFLAYVEGPTPESLLILGVRISPESITKLSEYPLGWDTLPYEASIRATGDSWAERQTSLALQVPSALCPGENSILINPRHSDATALSAYDLRSFRLDPRLRI